MLLTSWDTDIIEVKTQCQVMVPYRTFYGVRVVFLVFELMHIYGRQRVEMLGNPLPSQLVWNRHHHFVS